MIRQENEDILYIFLHIPKCAGTTFRTHLKYNFNHGELLDIQPSLEKSFEKRSEVDEYIRSLPLDKKEKIKVIFGHSVYFGIHEHFKSQPRYITFLRNPLTHALSSYNYICEHYDFYRKMYKNRRLPKNKDALSFKKWQELFDMNVQTHVVLNYTLDNRIGLYGDTKINEKHLEEARQILDNFYFVGLTETFEEDASFLFNELQIKKFIKKPQNVTLKKHIHKSKKLFDLISYATTLDQQLYAHAVQLNRDFKRNHPGFYEIVEDTLNGKSYLHLPLKIIFAEKLVSFFGLGTLTKLRNIKSIISEFEF